MNSRRPQLCPFVYLHSSEVAEGNRAAPSSKAHGCRCHWYGEMAMPSASLEISDIISTSGRLGRAPGQGWCLQSFYQEVMFLSLSFSVCCSVEACCRAEQPYVAYWNILSTQASWWTLSWLQQVFRWAQTFSWALLRLGVTKTLLLKYEMYKKPSRAMVVILKNAVSGARRRSEGTWESNPIKSFLPAVQIYLSKSCVCLWILGWRRLYIFFYPEIMRHSRKKGGLEKLPQQYLSIYLYIFLDVCVCTVLPWSCSILSSLVNVMQDWNLNSLYTYWLQ